MEKFDDRLDKKERPPVLYHGSVTRDLEELEPRTKSFRDPNEGPLVFASPDKAMASVFILKDVAFSGKFNDVPYALTIGSVEEFKKEDKGGHIYVLPSDGFVNDPEKGLGESEWTSSDSVRPLDVLDVKSSLDAAIENGVQVYFIDQAVCDAIRKSNDHGLEILRGLESENQRRGQNVRLLE